MHRGRAEVGRMDRARGATREPDPLMEFGWLLRYGNATGDIVVITPLTTVTRTAADEG